MNRFHLNIAIGAMCSMLAVAPALAASDYLLTLDDVKDGVTTSSPIEVASWSFGASNPSSVGSSGMSAGRAAAPLATPPATGGQVTIQTSREQGSGMATGRRCATGKHFASATLTQRTQSWKLSDVAVSACASDGMTLTYASASPITPVENGAKIGKSRSNIQNN